MAEAVVVDEAREDRDVPAMGVFMRKSAFRFVLESTARRALRSEEEVAGWLAVGLEEEWAAAGSALEVAAFEAAGIVFDWERCLKDVGRVIDKELSSLF